ncbi:MAG: UDP-3-O-(3-hydroxymyristoyl)glucosamine N-acyltransferase [Blastocatellia bacterium]|nr:UDP-3-O-(3-hydroxymyristoyl)glucosamine N-acyltransferase [Blastocatellia bacterium]
MKIKELSAELNCEFVGAPEIDITSVAPIENARPGDLTFLSNRKYRRYLATTGASAIILENAEDMPEGKAAVISPAPYLTFAEAMNLLYPALTPERGIHTSAIVSPSASIGVNVSIGPYSVIGDNVTIGDDVSILAHCVIYQDAQIGDGVLIHSHCVIREGCRLGDRVILQNNVLIGGDGFGYAKRPDNSWLKIRQAGIVIIEDDVEIGAGAAIDRATIGSTVISKGTKIDNLVQIGHGSFVGQNTLLCAQVGLAGSTRVGNEVILSGQVGAAGHLDIGDRVIATAQTGIPNSVDAGKIISGYPAIDNRDWLKSSAIFAQLPKLQREIRELKARLAKLEDQQGSQAQS